MGKASRRPPGNPSRRRSQERPGDREPDLLDALRFLAVRLAQAYGLSLDDAEDVAQEALLAFLLAEEPIQAPKAWLRRVVVRFVLRLQSRQDRFLPLPSDPKALAQIPEISPELGLELSRILSQLPPRPRTLLVLTAAGYSQREIAEILGCSVKQLGSEIARAQKKARKLRESAPSGPRSPVKPSP